MHGMARYVQESGPGLSDDACYHSFLIWSLGVQDIKCCASLTHHDGEENPQKNAA